MKHNTLLLFLTLLSFSCFSQEVDWIKTEAEITEIIVRRGKRTRESAMISFNLENGEKQIGSVELFRIPFLGSMKSVGDKITIYYDKDNPAVSKTIMGDFLSKYGMYILIFLGIFFSLKPFFKR